ncbi:hypothetical protein Y032_0039g62 [Ancylostoma ceylanicum]|nr:hypothetical protein Y032_0039g62 [Ancylostoma ceylanicum]
MRSPSLNAPSRGRQRLDSAERKVHDRKTTDPSWSDFFAKPFKERYDALRVSLMNVLYYSGTRERQIKGLLAPARYTPRSTGVKGIKVSNLNMCAHPLLT